ncbi:aldo/keto reductase [Schaalia sp. 19OD2882]|uniref:aldo/keto reductase n=1 Tax=Schaalia sp. 19OD2882 TaxID=2794089 RepID=UPI001C1ED9B9|nr:aldo/keto reductase [Schaalia sp. 19OD2882]QWW19359.1 aldo/keto reductase [Schaalia sp. 19OD2882]
MSADLIPFLPLATGATIPQLGFGTYKVAPEEAFDAVTTALELGYRHVDTAQMYRNEAEVGLAIEASPVPREQVFLTTKLDNANHEADVARRSFERSLEDLRTDHVDLFLIHWPLPTLYGGDFLACWRVLEEFHADGRARAIGVSNFQPSHLEQILAGCDVPPMVNQVEAHPFMANGAVHDFDAAHGILTEAWSPLARGRAVTDPTLGRIGRAHGVSASQVALRWAIQRGDVVFPKSVHRGRQVQNLDVFSFVLSEDEVALVGSLDEGEAGRCGSHPDTMNRL